MILRSFLLGSTVAAGMIVLVAQPAAAAPWKRGCVVREYGFAYRYGCRPESAETDPAADCARVSSVHFADEAEMRKALEKQPWRSKQEIDYIVKPPEIDKARMPTYVRFYDWGRAASYRGWRKGIETYVTPFAAPDPGQPEVPGRIGAGLNLDGKIKATDFIGTDGERGIDTALYRAWGCDAPFRNPASGFLVLRVFSLLLVGFFSVVFWFFGFLV